MMAVFTQTFAQPCDVDIYRAVDYDGFVVPHYVQDFFAREDPVAVCEEQLENFKFLFRKSDFVSVDFKPFGICVDGNTLLFYNVVVGGDVSCAA